MCLQNEKSFPSGRKPGLTERCAAMKFVKILLPIFIAAFLLSGCGSFKLASSIDDLISPVSPSGEDASVQSAMDTFCKGGYSVKIPAAGEYTTSYIYFDYDEDGTNEAIAFYEPNDALGKIDMAVLEKNDSDAWHVIANVQGEGTDVYSVDFCDVNGDGQTEFLISWNVISNSTTHLLSVYKYSAGEKGKIKLQAITDPMQYSAYIPVDMDGDAVQELMFFSVDQLKSLSANATLYSFRDDQKTLLGETKVDGHVSAYKYLQVGQADGDVAVYADAIRSDGNSMVTELIYWSDYYNSIISPFYSYNTGLTSDTTRDAMVPSCDINDDKQIEIPTDADFKDLPGGVDAVDWCAYKSSVLVHAAYSLVAQHDHYQVVIPDKYFKKISVSYDEDTRCMTVHSKAEKKAVFSVMPVLKSRFQEKSGEYADYTELFSDSGYIYLAKIGDASDIQISADALKDRIKTF